MNFIPCLFLIVSHCMKINVSLYRYIYIYIYLPSSGTQDCIHVVDQSSLVYARQLASLPPPPVSLEYLRAAEVIIREHNITGMPTCISDALHLYSLLVSTLELYV